MANKPASIQPGFGSVSANASPAKMAAAVVEGQATSQAISTIQSMLCSFQAASVSVGSSGRQTPDTTASRYVWRASSSCPSTACQPAIQSNASSCNQSSSIPLAVALSEWNVSVSPKAAVISAAVPVARPRMLGSNACCNTSMACRRT